MKDYAILIGINEYPQDAQLGELNGPHNDVGHIGKWLVRAKILGGGGLVPKNILSLKETDGNNTGAKYNDIISAVLSLRNSLTKNVVGNDRPLGGRLYLYFAGHGVYPPISHQGDNFEAAFLPEDWQPELAGQFIPVYQLTLFLMTTGYFKEIVMISDACRARMTQSISPQALPFSHDPAPNGYESKVILCYAARRNEFAIERNYDGTVLGAFSKAFSEALVAAPRSAAGELTHIELGKFVESRIPDLLGPHDYQHPRIEVRSGGWEIALASGPLPELEMRFSFENGDYADDIVLRDAEYMEVERFSAGSTSPVTLHLVAGEYLLTGPGKKKQEILNYELEGLDIVL